MGKEKTQLDVKERKMSRHDDIQNIMFRAIKDLSGMKHIYADTIKAAILSKMALSDIILTDDEKENAIREIKNALTVLGQYEADI